MAEKGRVAGGIHPVIIHRVTSKRAYFENTYRDRMDVKTDTFRKRNIESFDSAHCNGMAAKVEL